MNNTAKRQVAIRLLLAVGTYLVVAMLAGLSFWRHGSTTVPVTHAITGGSTYITYLVEPNSSVYQDNPGPVTVILLLLLVVAIVSTLSVVYRAVKHSPEVGVVGMVMACVVGAFCFVGMASVGMFLLPLAGLLVVLALPMSKLAEDLSHSRT